MKKFSLILIISLLITTPSYAQFGADYYSTALPSTCNIGRMAYQTNSVAGLYVCTSINTWTLLAPFTNPIPVGLITLKISGTCSAGWSEVSGLDGVMLRGTLNSHGNVGTSGGNDTITPTVSSLTAAAQTFTGNSVTSSAVSAGTPAGTNGTGTVTPLGTNGTVSITPLLNAIAWPAGVPTNAAITAGTPAGTNAASATSGNCAATNVLIGTGAANACKATAPNLTVTAQVFTGSALGTHTHTISWPAGVPTVTGASTTVGAETFTGSSSVTSAEVFTGSALGTHTHATTATGTNGTSAVIGTLNSFDNRPAYVNVIFCSKD